MLQYVTPETLTMIIHTKIHIPLNISQLPSHYVAPSGEPLKTRQDVTPETLTNIKSADI